MALHTLKKHPLVSLPLSYASISFDPSPLSSGASAFGVFSTGLMTASLAAAETFPEYISDRELTVVRAISTTLSTRFRRVSLALSTV